MKRAAVGLCLLLLAVGLSARSATAEAARYASPTGSGSTCSQAVPCSIQTVFSGAGTGDDIYLMADQGDYNLSSMISATGLFVHGLNGRARLIFSSGRLALTGGSNGSAEHLYVQAPGTALQLFGPHESADDVIAKVTDTGHACFMQAATMTNSVCWAATTGDLALETDGSNTLRGDTLIGGTEAALKAFGRNPTCSCATATDTLVNVIARPAIGGVGIEANSDGTAVAQVNVTYSNYPSTSLTGTGAPALTQINGDGTDQTDVPQFVDAAGGDFHQVLGSPTVDHGVNDAANGTTDFDGQPRTAHGTTDIGADELEMVTLTVQKAGSGSGSVTSSPAGIDCGSTCTTQFLKGTPVTLTESTSDAFGGWSGDCVGTQAMCDLTMTGNKTVTATFSPPPPPTHTLTVTKKGKGKVTSAPAGITCGADCTQAFDEGTAVTLAKKPHRGWHFVKWTGGCTGRKGCSVTMDADRSVKAVFAKNP